MASPWRTEAEVIADETFLSVREAETILAFEALSHPDGLLPPPKEVVYAEIADSLGVESTTVRTYLARARAKMERGVATATFVEHPDVYQADDQLPASLSELLNRQSVTHRGVGSVW